MGTEVIQAVADGRVIQLGQPLAANPTRGRGVPDFELEMYEEHVPGRTIIPGQYEGVSSAADTITMATHSGTHMDSLGHIGYQGKLFDGTRIADDGVQATQGGVRLATRESLAPIVARGVLYDFPALLGVSRLSQDYVITLAELDRAIEWSGVSFGRGDVVLFRTGWDTIAENRDEYIRMPIPGPDADVARRLVQAGVVATGSDTMPYESAPGTTPLEVHVELLPKGGVFIFEMLDLRELASAGAKEFLFVALPLRIVGGSGSPINPVAVLA